jgi:hypothetical protein
MIAAPNSHFKVPFSKRANSMQSADAESSVLPWRARRPRSILAMMAIWQTVGRHTDEKHPYDGKKDQGKPERNESQPEGNINDEDIAD